MLKCLFFSFWKLLRWKPTKKFNKNKKNNLELEGEKILEFREFANSDSVNTFDSLTYSDDKII